MDSLSEMEEQHQVAGAPLATAMDQRGGNSCADACCDGIQRMIVMEAFHYAGHTASGVPPVGHFCTRNPAGYWSALHTSQPSGPIVKLDSIRFFGY